MRGSIACAMNIAVLRELHGARPFVPFTLTLADGRKLPVIHNEFLAFFPSGRAAMLTHKELVTSADVDAKFRTRRARAAAKKR